MLTLAGAQRAVVDDLTLNVKIDVVTRERPKSVEYYLVNIGSATVVCFCNVSGSSLYAIEICFGFERARWGFDPLFWKDLLFSEVYTR